MSKESLSICDEFRKVATSQTKIAENSIFNLVNATEWKLTPFRWWKVHLEIVAYCGLHIKFGKSIAKVLLVVRVDGYVRGRYVRLGLLESVEVVWAFWKFSDEFQGEKTSWKAKNVKGLKGFWTCLVGLRVDLNFVANGKATGGVLRLGNEIESTLFFHYFNRLCNFVNIDLWTRPFYDINSLPNNCPSIRAPCIENRFWRISIEIEIRL